MIASDLDGTLFDRDHRVSERTASALRAARSEGVVVVAATGRAPRSAVDRLAGLDIVDVLVCSNGAIIHDPVDDITTDRFVIDAGHVSEIFECLDAGLPGVSFCWELAEGSSWDDEFHHIASNHSDLDVYEPGPRPGPDESVSKLMVLHPELRREALIEEFRRHVEAPVSLGCSGVPFIEVTGEGVDKATALHVVARRYDIDVSQVVAFGDNNNDIAMLQWAGVGIAVANAAAEAAAVADAVIGHHDDDSVASWVEQLLARW